jgi:hypothetical protein
MKFLLINIKFTLVQLWNRNENNIRKFKINCRSSAEVRKKYTSKITVFWIIMSYILKNR